MRFTNIPKRTLSWILSGISGLLYVLLIPRIRDFVWKNTVGRAREKVVDAKAHVVEELDEGDDTLIK
jgi:hypothetical protein